MSERPGSQGPPRRVQDLDWPSWRPTDRATLVFVCRDDHILLIRKKRGLGAGKINGPGGRLDPGETPRQCAVREAQEELDITPVEPRESGRLRFQFIDGYGLDVHVFKSGSCLGTARETEEAVPLWTPVNAIPFDEMWQDDRLWIPHLLADRPFHGRFIFDGDAMLDHHLELDVDLASIPPPPRPG